MDFICSDSGCFSGDWDLVDGSFLELVESERDCGDDDLFLLLVFFLGFVVIDINFSFEDVFLVIYQDIY